MRFEAHPFATNPVVDHESRSVSRNEVCCHPVSHNGGQRYDGWIPDRAVRVRDDGRGRSRTVSPGPHVFHRHPGPNRHRWDGADGGSGQPVSNALSLSCRHPGPDRHRRHGAGIHEATES